MTIATAPDIASGTTTSPASELLTKAQLAELLQLSERTIENMQQRGLPYMALGPRRNRYVRSDVLAWLRSEYTVRKIGGRP